MIHRLLPLAALPLLLMGTAAIAQAQGGERVNQVTVYDAKDCPEERADTITSCIVVQGESRFRIPSALRTEPQSPVNTSASVKAIQTITPVSGFGSCSASGIASNATCAGKEYEAWKKAQGTGSGAVYSGLIEKERRERLGQIDSEAADQQAIVDAEATDRGNGVVTVDQAPATGVSPGTGTSPVPGQTSNPVIVQPIPPR